MASGEEQALKILERQVESLTAQLQTLTSERDEYRDALAEVSTDRDQLREQIGNPGDTAKELTALRQQIRDRNHFDKFAELAKGDHAREGAVKHLWKLSDYKAEADEPDEAALKGILKKLRAEADYAFEPEGTATTTTAAQTAARVTSRTRYGLDVSGNTSETITPSKVEGRGDRNKGHDGTLITREMLADPKFMLDPANKALIRDAAIGHRFVP